eukprot:TRINITY_DN38694_c1_g1_i1.p1 TRINITY_DN38694_c1_g1~~TRINITY_DN38694_c1_g1_i1.p1  ORF type:complete len:811 (+),score=150.05 TRINITY_DN38694_c1_g1_i1:133-2565(+)
MASARGGDTAYRLKKKLLPGYFSRVNRVMGRVCNAKGLPNCDSFGKSDPYCVVKGIRSNNHLVNMFVTKAMPNTLSPEWEEEFDFEVPSSWGIVELVGLQVTVFDADEMSVSWQGNEDFLGGGDLDLSNAVSGRTVTHEIELGGIPVTLAKGKKPRISLVITVYRESVPKPPPAEVALHKSLQEVHYIREVIGKVVKAKGLRNMDVIGKSDPVCIVRAVRLSGAVEEVTRTQVIDDELNPHWDVDFRIKHDILNPAVLALFDIWDVDDDQKPAEQGDHLGSAVVCLRQCLPPRPREKKILLQPLSQHHESRLDQDGNHRSSYISRSTTDVTDRPRSKESRYSSKEVWKNSTRMQRVALWLKENLTSGFGLTAVRRPIISVEMRSREKIEPMPFADVMDRPVDVADEDDVEEVLSWPDWKRTEYAPPTELNPQRNQNGRPPRGQLLAEDRIVFLHGVIHGASGLMTGRNDRTNAYVVVHMLTRQSEQIFIHRTRVVANKQCPEWGESFYAAIEKDVEVTRIMVSVYHKDINDATSIFSRGVDVDEDKQDMPLGSSTLDVSRFCSGDMLSEHVPLSGGHVVKKVKVSSGFRRNSTLFLDLAVERLVMPFYGTTPEDAHTAIPRRTHTLSNQPNPNVSFWDASQQEPIDPPFEEAATDALMLNSTGQLLADGVKPIREKWLVDLSYKGPKIAALDFEDEVEKKRRKREMQIEREAEQRRKFKEGIIPPGYDYTKRAPLPKSKSLPLLHTTFGKDPEFFRQEVQRTKPPGTTMSTTLRQVFNAKSTSLVYNYLKAMKTKPAPEELVTRKEQPLL